MMIYRNEMSDFDVNLKKIIPYESDVNQVNEKENNENLENVNAADEVMEHKSKEDKISKEKKELISSLLANVEKINIIDYAKEKLGYIPSYNKDGEPLPLKQKHLKVALIEYFNDIANSNNWKITKDKSETIYLFNGAYWIPFYKDDIVYLLREFIIKTGIPLIEAKDELFKEKLYKQFLSEIEPFYKKSNNLSVINLLNGTLDLENMQLKKFDYKDFLTYQLPFAYDEKAVNELWLQFLDEVLPDKETQRTLQEVIGSIFVKGIKLEYATFLYGSGANGKSVVMEVIAGVLGRENVSFYSLDDLMQEHYRALIKDKLLNFGSENNTKKLQSDTFKKLASGEPIGARQKYGKPFTMENYARLIFAVNQMKLKEIEYTDGFFRRFLIIPFKRTIPREKRDKKLHLKILQNPAGVLNWIIDGAKRVLINEDVFISNECKEARKQFIKDIDSVLQFLDENNYKKSDYFRKYIKDFYNEYKEWSFESGIRPVGKREFSKRLEALGYIKRKDKNWYFLIEKK
ncbi:MULTISPECIES: phage/plasmid primase, P4 family [unclassified Lebetimonas]|uniref:DNA primase family protein n=1 Tax=unclassified Lebetimonas TaxID=2648158 RepID=UPI00046493E6|nr:MULTISPECIES: DNA primase family protein [unclassified Lebetimonas]